MEIEEDQDDYFTYIQGQYKRIDNENTKLLMLKYFITSVLYYEAPQVNVHLINTHKKLHTLSKYILSFKAHMLLVDNLEIK